MLQPPTGLQHINIEIIEYKRKEKDRLSVYNTNNSNIILGQKRSIYALTIIYSHNIIQVT